MPGSDASTLDHTLASADGARELAVGHQVAARRWLCAGVGLESAMIGSAASAPGACCTVSPATNAVSCSRAS